MSKRLEPMKRDHILVSLHEIEKLAVILELWAANEENGLIEHIAHRISNCTVNIEELYRNYYQDKGE